MALGTYTTIENVEAAIGTTFGTATVPTIAQVENWIDWASDSIESLTNQTFGTTQGTVVDEYIDFNRYNARSNSETGYLQTTGILDRTDRTYTGGYQIYNSFQTQNKPIGTVVSLDKNTALYPTQPNFDQALLEDVDFIVYPEEGLVTITSNTTIPYGKRRFRITYTYGSGTPVPGNVQRLATLMVTKNVLESKVSNSNFGNTDDIRVGEIAIKKSGVSTRNQLEQVNKEIDRLVQEVGNLTVAQVI